MSILINIVLFVIFVVLTTLPITFFTGILKSAGSKVATLVGTITAVVIVAFLVWFANSRGIISSDLHIFTKANFIWAFGCFIVLNIVAFIFGHFGVDVSSNDDVIGQVVKNYPLMGLILSVFTAPLIEELVFRGFFIQSFFKNHMFIGLIIVSFIFGLLHVISKFDWKTAAYFVLGGFLIGLPYVMTGNIEASIMTHFFMNGITYLNLLSMRD